MGQQQPQQYQQQATGQFRGARSSTNASHRDASASADSVREGAILYQEVPVPIFLHILRCVRKVHNLRASCPLQNLTAGLLCGQCAVG